MNTRTTGGRLARRTLAALAAGLLGLTAACSPPAEQTPPSTSEITFWVVVYTPDGRGIDGVPVDFTISAVSNNRNPVDVGNDQTGQHSTQTQDGEGVTPHPIHLTVNNIATVSLAASAPLEVGERLACWLEVGGARIDSSVSEYTMTPEDADPLLPATVGEVFCFWASA